MGQNISIQLSLAFGFPHSIEKKIILNICFVLALVNDSDAAVASEVRTRLCGVWEQGGSSIKNRSDNELNRVNRPLWFD